MGPFQHQPALLTNVENNDIKSRRNYSQQGKCIYGSEKKSVQYLIKRNVNKI